jgi:hypothetical protein
VTLRTALARIATGPDLTCPLSTRKRGRHPENVRAGQSGPRKPQRPSEQHQRKTRPTLPPTKMHNRRRRNNHTQHRLAHEHRSDPVLAIAERGKHPNHREHENHLAVTAKPGRAHFVLGGTVREHLEQQLTSYGTHR